MGRSFSTWILLAGVFLMVAAGVFVITTIALNDSDDANGSTAASSGPDEQHVYLTNLGMT